MTTIQRDLSGLRLRAVREAIEKFGTKPADPDAVGRWVQLRVAQLTGETTSTDAQPQLFDDEIVEPEHRSE